MRLIVDRCTVGDGGWPPGARADVRASYGQDRRGGQKQCWEDSTEAVLLNDTTMATTSVNAPLSMVRIWTFKPSYRTRRVGTVMMAWVSLRTPPDRRTHVQACGH